VHFPEDVRQSDQNKHQKQCLCRAFIGAHDKGAIYCSAFCASAHGKEPSLPCVFSRRMARSPSLPCVFYLAHGKGRRTPLHPGAVSCFCLPCAVKKRTTKIIYRALSDATHNKGALPCKMLPCALCRVPRRKTHNKEFAVCFRPLP
jgi:hypothetical protein